MANIAKDLAIHIQQNTPYENVSYSSMPDAPPDDPKAICVYEYDPGIGVKAIAPNVIPTAFRVACRAATYDEALAMSHEIFNLLKNVGNEMWGQKPLVVTGTEFVRILARGVPMKLKEDEQHNIYTSQNFYTWINKKERF